MPGPGGGGVGVVVESCPESGPARPVWPGRGADRVRVLLPRPWLGATVLVRGGPPRRTLSTRCGPGWGGDPVPLPGHRAFPRGGAALGAVRLVVLDREVQGFDHLTHRVRATGAVGAGVGYPFLRQAVDAAWRQNPRGVTVNTCTADHPRALPTYLRAGFRSLRQVREVWNVPLRLGMRIPERLLG